MEVFTAKDLTFTYAGTQTPTLQNISFSVPENAFVLLYGASGSGKTTLLRLLKSELTPKGNRQGELLYREKPLSDLPQDISIREIAYTAQNPDTQQVSDYVKNELAFLPENLGLPQAEIQLKIAETVGFFGISDLYTRKIQTLSGGEKQLVNLAAACVGTPRVLLLDEPFAMLDAFGAERLLRAIVRLHQILGVTVLVTEHNIQPLLPYLTGVLVLENGRLNEYRSADAFLRAYPDAAPSVTVPHLLGALCEHTVPPKTEAQARAVLQTAVPHLSLPVKPPAAAPVKPILELKNASFRYMREGKDVLSDLSFSLGRGEIFAVIGANGAGKTTLLRVLSGENKPYSGKRKVFSDLKIAAVPQNPQACFAFETVAEVLNAASMPPTPKALFHLLNDAPSTAPAPLPAVSDICKTLGIADTLAQNPFDLSAGQQQRVAFAAALLKNPDVLLLDEPTKGLDKQSKDALLPLLADWKKAGKALLLVTHDLDFAAACTDRCALLFDGHFVFSGESRAFFTHGDLYTSTVARMFSYLSENERPISLSEVQNANAK
ncbi:MAG: ATP-binding cassette domain-containing protein [Clostridia bacterium]|nr:ATP-binding cassette domain-containing protein [Clostridia bacterium]